MRTRWVVGALVLALAGVPAAPAAAQDEGPPVVRAKSGKRVVRARPVTWCWESTAHSVCADGPYGHSEAALPWRPRAPLVFGTSAPVDKLGACLMKVQGEGRARALGVCLSLTRGDDGKWRGRMPKNLRGANSLAVAVASGTNDAFYAVSVER